MSPIWSNTFVKVVHQECPRAPLTGRGDPLESSGPELGMHGFVSVFLYVDRALEKDQSRITLPGSFPKPTTAVVVVIVFLLHSKNNYSYYDYCCWYSENMRECYLECHGSHESFAK